MVAPRLVATSGQLHRIELICPPSDISVSLVIGLVCVCVCVCVCVYHIHSIDSTKELSKIFCIKKDLSGLPTPPDAELSFLSSQLISQIHHSHSCSQEQFIKSLLDRIRY